MWSQNNYEKLNHEIVVSMRENQEGRRNAYRIFKSKLLEYEKSKGAVLNIDGSIPDATEIAILNKLVKQYYESIESYHIAGAIEREEKELSEVRWLSQLLPKEPTVEDYRNAIDEYEKRYAKPNVKDMGIVIKFIKNLYPTGDGKTISSVVKEYLSESKS